MLTKRSLALHVCVMTLALAGSIVLGSDLAPVWRAVEIALVVAVLAIRVFPLDEWLRPAGTVIEYVGAGLGLLVVPVFAVLGIDWLLGLGIGPAPPAVRLVAGGVLVLLTARVSLEPFWTDRELPHPWALAASDVVLLLIVPSLAIAIIGQLNGDGATLDQRPLVSNLDVVVLRAPGHLSAPATVSDGEWRIHVWTGTVTGHRVVWAGGQEPPVAGDPGADRVLLLLPSPADDSAVARWMGLADSVEPRATPTYALLTTPNAAQLRAWRRPLSGVSGRVGDALDIAALGGASQTEAELGLRAASESPAAAADLALAVAHRPILMFDSGEPVPRPLDIDQLLATGDISMCESGQKLRSRCVQIHGGDDLQTGFSHMAFDTHTLATAKVASPIYVHVTDATQDVPVDHLPKKLIYLDYWWYLPDNPAHSGGGAFCGPGFEIAGVTCFDHQSDWEGVTAILDGRDPAGPPVAVNYAEHDGSARYSWAALSRLWLVTGASKLVPADATAIRPVVFSARGTHASYPIACSHVSCPPTAVPGVADTSALEDNPHDGKRAWLGATDTGCAGACVALLPTRHDGTEPGSWNAWAGEWGTANCIVGLLFCSSSQPPQSPGQQGRYERPWCTNQAFDFSNMRFARTPNPACRAPVISAGPLIAGRRLLALGDSYSSGEGGGDYAPDTDNETDSCHRSSKAWPALLAHERNLTLLPSLACSGATTTDILSGRAGSAEPERRVSQISRISGRPNVITLTIGGDDLGFKSVLEHCIIFNCIRTYHRPSGDLLDLKIDQLARRLPGLYRAIQAAAPKARLIVVDYPKLFANAVPNCAAEGLITPAEGDYLNGEIERADVAILDSARAAGADAVDVSDALASGVLSCSGPQYVNPTSPRLKLLSGSFHPDATGQEKIADAVAAQLAVLDH
jgi:lysophospholipase L1-like esterase